MYIERMKVSVKTHLLFVALLFGFVLWTDAQVNPRKKCSTGTNGGRYHLVSESRALDQEGLLIFIVVKPDRINEEYLRQVASEIKARYCNEVRVVTVISDKKKYADPAVLSEYRDSKSRIAKMRGFYSFDRRNGIERLEFSTRLGNPPDEIKVKL